MTEHRISHTTIANGLASYRSRTIRFQCQAVISRKSVWRSETIGITRSAAGNTSPPSAASGPARVSEYATRSSTSQDPRTPRRSRSATPKRAPAQMSTSNKHGNPPVNALIRESVLTNAVKLKIGRGSWIGRYSTAGPCSSERRVLSPPSPCEGPSAAGPRALRSRSASKGKATDGDKGGGLRASSRTDHTGTGHWFSGTTDR